MNIGLAIVLIIVALAGGGIAGFFIGGAHRKKVAEAAIGSATQEAARIVNNAMTEAEQKKKETILEAKDEIHKLRTDTEQELRERRNEVQRQEKRIIQKEETLDKKVEQHEKKEEALAKKAKAIDDKEQEIESLKKSQLEILERISGYTKEQAKEVILQTLEEQLVHDKAVKIFNHEQQLKDDMDKLAAEILSGAIQRCAADHAAEATVSVVSIPSDEMKGRIIGREGRNIRAIEATTGVDLIIDDTPEAITVSCFEPVRREVARLTLERLVNDGRIHPGSIEAIYEKAKKDVENDIRQAGEKAAIDAGVNGLRPEILKTLGKLKYRTSYGQNVLNHSLEVSYLSGVLAAELGADIKMAKRAGLLHDIGKAVDHEQEGTHIELGVALATKFRENEQVIHAIHAHHGDVESVSVLDFIVQAADAISAARPGARRENIEAYIQRLKKLEEIAGGFPGVEGTFANQAGREVRILVKPDAITDDQMTILARDVAKKIEEELEYPGQIKVNVIRESRAVDFAK